MSRLVTIDQARFDDAVEVLAAAFTDYPVFTYVLPPDTEDRARKLAAVMRYYAWRRLVRQWPLLGIEADSALLAIVSANPPHDGSEPPGVEAQEQQLISVIGEAAEQRRRAYESASGIGFPPVPHYFIGMIGVRPEARGQGHAGQLMSEIHARAIHHPHAQGVALVTESETNLEFYAHLGYRITGEGQVDDLRSWSLWRDNDE